jgi:hypothetical protein
MDQLSPAVASLLEQAVHRPAHFTPLRRGHLESVAALYEVHPFVVSELREQLQRPGVRQAVAGRLFRTWRARRSSAVSTRAPRRVAPTVAALLEAVRATAGGQELLLHAPIETVATMFHVHPFVVDAARVEATAAAQRA